MEIMIKKGTLNKLELSNRNLKLNNLFHNKKTQNPYNLTATIITSSSQIFDITDDPSTEWISTNHQIASVTNGQVYTMNTGNVKISAKFKGYSAETKVTVDNKKIKDINLSRQEVFIENNSSEQIILSAQLEDGSIKDISALAAWESADHTVVTVCDGILYAEGKGETSIHVSYGDYRNKIKVSVSS